MKRRLHLKSLIGSLLLLGSIACRTVTLPASATPTPLLGGVNDPVQATIAAAVTAYLQTELPNPTATTTVVPSPERTPEPTLTPTVTPTPDAYAGLSIASLAVRTYGGGQLEVAEVLDSNSYFTRTLITYPSDGLAIYGFMNVPKRVEPPFPVVIALHGYIEPEVYQTIDYTTRYADALARAGYLVLHPNLRGYQPSEEGDNLFRVGMAVDVLNLIAIVQEQGGKPGPLQGVDPQSIGLWGHSMGGGISTRVITVSPAVRATVLYGAMSGDERRNFERIFGYFSNGERGLEELSYPPEAFESISPINYLERIQAAVSIHHGEADSEVPPGWSRELCSLLEGLGKSVECFSYPGQPHTFYGEGDDLFMQRMIAFYDRWLR